MEGENNRMSSRNLRSTTGFPKDEIFVQRNAVAGPNNSVVNADITLDLEGNRAVQIVGTEMFFDSHVLGAGSQILGIATLNPDKVTLAEDINDLGDDNTIHFFRHEKDFATAVGSVQMLLTDYRRYPEHGFTYAQQRFRFLFFSAQNLAGGFFGGALYYRLTEVNEETALAILRRR